jgi:hypothetical protein
MNNTNIKNDHTIIINPIYCEDVIHVNNAIPITDDNPFTIAIVLDEQESIAVPCLHKLRHCAIIICFMGTSCFCFFMIIGGIGFFLNLD